MKFAVLTPHAVETLERDLPGELILGWDVQQIAEAAHPKSKRRQRRLAGELERALPTLKTKLHSL